MGLNSGEYVAGPVVDDEEDLSRRLASDEGLQESQEGLGIEDVGESIRKARFETCGSKDVRDFSHSKGVDAGPVADASPGAVERSVEPEAEFVAKEHDTAAWSGLFLIAGSFFFSQMPASRGRHVPAASSAAASCFS
jgi:hypothetical protein